MILVNDNYQIIVTLDCLNQSDRYHNRHHHQRDLLKQGPVSQFGLTGLNRCLKKRDETSRTNVWGSNRAAAANWFFRLGELGSVDRALAANSSLLDDIEMVFRLVTT